MSHAFRTAPNRPINPSTDDLGTLGGTSSWASAINGSGQVVGYSDVTNGEYRRAFRTAPNSPINPATDDLGTLYPAMSFETVANAINEFGEVVGFSMENPQFAYIFHAFRTAPNSPINPTTDDLGSLPYFVDHNNFVVAFDINAAGSVVGYEEYGRRHAFVYSGGTMHDLKDLIPAGYPWVLEEAIAINDVGQIVGYRQDVNPYWGSSWAGFLLTPIYRASVQQPINGDGSSIFSSKKGVVPVKFSFTQYDAPTCGLLPATIEITRVAGGTLGAIDESTYLTNADSGSNFRISGCQYVYNLAASSLGIGKYRVNINVSGITVGHAVFALK